MPRASAFPSLPEVQSSLRSGPIYGGSNLDKRAPVVSLTVCPSVCLTVVLCEVEVSRTTIFGPRPSSSNKHGGFFFCWRSRIVLTRRRRWTVRELIKMRDRIGSRATFLSRLPAVWPCPGWRRRQGRRGEVRGGREGEDSIVQCPVTSYIVSHPFAAATAASRNSNEGRVECDELYCGPCLDGRDEPGPDAVGRASERRLPTDFAQRGKTRHPL